MDITYYMFASYVFLLVLGTIWFYGRIMRRSKTKNGGEEKERQLFRLYQNIEDMLGGFEEYAEEAKAGIDERLKQAETLIERMHAAQPGIEQVGTPVERKVQAAAKSDHADRPEKGAAQPEAEPARVDKPADESPEKPKKPRKSSRRASGKPNPEELIAKYIAQGMDKAEIARALGKSQREVSLIMEVKKINISDEKPKDKQPG